jgi:hypothetical protein
MALCMFVHHFKKAMLKCSFAKISVCVSLEGERLSEA